MKYKHLSDKERYQIQHGLDAGKSFKQIGREINRDCTTISKEIRARRTFRQTGSYAGPFNDCALYWDCLHNSLCPGAPCRAKLCRVCTKAPCRKLCKDYKKKICHKRESPPYTCNSCETRNRCTLEKAFYSARGAQAEYETILTESRSGVCVSESEIQRLDAILSPPLRQGQSIHHILAHSAPSVMWSEKTIYKYVGLNLFQSRNIDMPRKVRFRPRKSKHESLKVDKCCRINRTYEDYNAFLAGYPDTPVVQMDTVHGTVGGKCLLTLHFVSAHFMLAYLLDACTSQAVTDTFRSLRELLGCDCFAKLFFIILGDNGSEFSDPKTIEFDHDGTRLCNVFYCDANMSQQKGALEVNHEFIRRIIPKGISMDGYSQRDISLMMDHINSYGRKALNDRTPYHLFQFLFGPDPIKRLGANLIDPGKIILRPTLLNR